MSKGEMEDYLAKLKDPEFVQNLTRSYVFHHTEPSINKHPDQNKNVVGNGPVSYVPQTSNPFFFRHKSTSGNGNLNNQIITKSNKVRNLQRQSG